MARGDLQTQGGGSGFTLGSTWQPAASGIDVVAPQTDNATSHGTVNITVTDDVPDAQATGNAAGTVVLGIFLFGESADLARLGCIGLIMAGIAGLKLTA